MFSVLKIAKQENKLAAAIKYFAKDDFKLSNSIWRQVFLDPELQTLKTEKTIQKYAIQLILKHLKINVKMTKKEKLVYNNFNIDSSTL